MIQLWRAGAARLFGLIVCLGALVALGGCNTAEGFGKDLESAGQAIQKSTDDEDD
jgi:predicted small secreted protein